LVVVKSVNKTPGPGFKDYLCGMTTESIEKFFESQTIPANKSIRIDFKKRNAILGVIVRGNDYEDLKSKNFWRVVMQSNFETWERSRSVDVAKIYSGSEFTRLSIVANTEMV
jgi:hypothetical protein